MYAIVGFGGHQYIVQKGMELLVDKLDVNEGEEYVVENVLAFFDEKGEKVELGTPCIADSKVLFEVVSHEKGDKIKVVKFKRKNRYHKTQGFRAKQTLLKVKDIKVHG